ncbi:MAG: xylan 1,4-beta-xylosidase, partial [Mycobacterium sp.]
PDAERKKVPVADGLVALKSGRTLLIVNTTDAPISATVHSEQVELSPYEVKWVTLPQRVSVLDWVEDTFTG